MEGGHLRQKIMNWKVSSPEKTYIQFVQMRSDVKVDVLGNC